MGDGFSPSTFIPVGDLRPWIGSPKFKDPAQAALYTAYLALTEGQRRILESSIRAEKGLKGSDLIAARLNPAGAGEPDTGDDDTEYADLARPDFDRTIS
jgi:hypothetical protein